MACLRSKFKEKLNDFVATYEYIYLFNIKGGYSWEISATCSPCASLRPAQALAPACAAGGGHLPTLAPCVWNPLALMREQERRNDVPWPMGWTEIPPTTSNMQSSGLGTFTRPKSGWAKIAISFHIHSHAEAHQNLYGSLLIRGLISHCFVMVESAGEY
jgi:hypothetical protein